MSELWNLQFYTVVDGDADGSISPALSRPRRTICPSCSSETGTKTYMKHLYKKKEMINNTPPTGDLPGSEDSEVSRHNRGYECSAASAPVVADANDVYHLCPSLQHSCTFTSFKPTAISIATTPDSPKPGEGDAAGTLTLQKVTCGWLGNNNGPHKWSQTPTNIGPYHEMQGQLKVIVNTGIYL